MNICITFQKLEFAVWQPELEMSVQLATRQHILAVLRVRADDQQFVKQSEMTQH